MNFKKYVIGCLMLNFFCEHIFTADQQKKYVIIPSTLILKQRLEAIGSKMLIEETDLIKQLGSGPKTVEAVAAIIENAVTQYKESYKRTLTPSTAEIFIRLVEKYKGGIYFVILKDDAEALASVREKFSFLRE